MILVVVVVVIVLFGMVYLFKECLKQSEKEIRPEKDDHSKD